MARIEPGMLVEIIDGPTFIHQYARKYIGHIGKVLSEGIHSPSGNRTWSIEGAKVETSLEVVTFSELHLRPIPDDTAFDTFIGEVFKPVDIGVTEKVKANG